MNAPLNTSRPGARASLPHAATGVGSAFSNWRKVCSCGRAHRWEQWNALRLDGVMTYEYPPGEVDEETGEPLPDREVLEYRTCVCGSTMTIDLLEIVDMVRPEGTR